MTEEEAKKLVRDAIAAGIVNDMGSGSNVDLAILKPNDYCEVTILLIQINPIRQSVKLDSILKVYALMTNF